MAMPGEQESRNNNPVTKKSKGAKMESRFKGVLERKIESIYDESQALGWDYTSFVSSVLEVLAALHYRNTIR